MVSADALKERIELVESRLKGVVVRVLEVQLYREYALARIQAEGRKPETLKYKYGSFFSSRQLR